MISECLRDIDKPTDIHKFYNQESPNKYPSLLICKDKLEKQNRELDNYQLNMYNYGIINGTYNRYNYDMCNETLNHKLYMDNKNNRANNNLIYNYFLDAPTETPHPINLMNNNKNIDVESELKRINHIRDKCYNDNYKINHDNDSFQNFKKIYENQKTLLTDIKTKTNTRFNKIPEKCNGPFEKFELCNQNDVCYPKGLYTEENMPVNYRFSNQKYCDGFECQKLFHNTTRRSMVSRININEKLEDVEETTFSP